MDLSFFSQTLINDPLLSKNAVVTIGGISKSIKVVYSNDYNRNGLMDTSFQGSAPYVICNCLDVEDAVVNVSTITIEGENNNLPFTVREVKVNNPSHTILILSYD